MQRKACHQVVGTLRVSDVSIGTADRTLVAKKIAVQYDATQNPCPCTSASFITGPSQRVATTRLPVPQSNARHGCTDVQRPFARCSLFARLQRKASIRAWREARKRRNGQRKIPVAASFRIEDPSSYADRVHPLLGCLAHSERGQPTVRALFEIHHELVSLSRYEGEKRMPERKTGKSSSSLFSLPNALPTDLAEPAFGCGCRRGWCRLMRTLPLVFLVKEPCEIDGSLANVWNMVRRRGSTATSVWQRAVGSQRRSRQKVVRLHFLQWAASGLDRPEGW